MKQLLRTIGVIALALIMLVIIKNEYARLLMSHANHGLQALISRAGEEQEDGQEPYDLYLGSSLFRQGLDIQQLDAAGGNNYILAYNAAQPFLIYNEISYLLDHGVPIASVTVDMYANASEQEPWIEDTRLLLDTDLQCKLDLWQEMRRSSQASSADLWELLVTSNNDKLLIWPVDYALVNPMFEDGGNLLVNSGASESDLDELLRSRSTSDDTATYTMNEVQRSYLQRIIRLCKEQGIALTFLETPKYGTLDREREYVEIMHQYCSLLQAEQVVYYLSEDTAASLAEHQYGLDIDADRVIPFDNENADYYIDLVHLSSDGRQAYTANYLETRENAGQAYESNH